METSLIFLCCYCLLLSLALEQDVWNAWTYRKAVRQVAHEFAVLHLYWKLYDVHYLTDTLFVP